MLTTKIRNSDIAQMKVASLPSRPTAPTTFGGKGYTAAQLKEAFDRLPLYLVEKFNSLLDDISALGPDSLAAAIPTGLREGHTLADFFSDIVCGTVTNYLLLENEESIAGAFRDVLGRLQQIESFVQGKKTLDGESASGGGDTLLVRRDTENLWRAINPILRNGEIAVVQSPTGYHRLLIGNGSSAYSDLIPIGGGVKTITGEDVSLTPRHGADLRLGTLTSLAISLPDSYEEDYYAFFSFDSGVTPTAFSYTDGAILFTGDDVEDGVFVPLAGKHYSLFLWYDGMMQCIVRGMERT